jgi:hypothetical protein
MLATALLQAALMSETVECEALALPAVATGYRSATERALALPEILDPIIAWSLELFDIWQIQLVNKLWQAATEPHLVKWLYICGDRLLLFYADILHDVGHLLSKQPMLSRNVKRVHVDAHSSLGALLADHLASFSNLSTLDLDDRDVVSFASMSPANSGFLRNLRKMAFGLNLPLLSDQETRAKCHAFFQSLVNLAAMRIVLFSTAYREGSFSDFYLGEIFGSMAGQIRDLAMSGVDLDRCDGEEVSHLFQTFNGVEVLDLTLPERTVDSYVPGLVDCLPPCLLSLKLSCGVETLNGVLESLADPTTIPKLRLVPNLSQNDRWNRFSSMEDKIVSPTLIKEALRGLEKRKDIANLEEGKFNLYRRV